MRHIPVLFIVATVVALRWLTAVDAQTTTLRTGFLSTVFGKALGNDEKVVVPEKAPEQDAVSALTRRVDFPGIADPKATLNDALKLFSSLYHVTFEINTRAFEAEWLREPGVTPVADDKPVPAMKKARLEHVLKQALRLVPCETGATFLVRGDAIEITTRAFVQKEVWGENLEGPFLPLVHVRAENQPLGEALHQLARQGRFNILYAGGADKAATAISIHLNNAPLDTAVRMMAHQAGLAVVHRDNVLIVTSEEKAAALNAAFRSEIIEADKKSRRGYLRDASAETDADSDAVAALTLRVDFPGFSDPKTTLNDGLTMLSSLYHVHFEINEQAFRSKGLKDPGEVLLADPAPLPGAKSVRLGMVLKQVLARVPSDAGGYSFMVHGGVIELTTPYFAHQEACGEGFEGPFLPLVHVRAEKQALGEALKQLADQSKFNIVYAGGADKATTSVSGHLNNVPLDTAVRLLAIQAGLAVLHRDNVLLVTTEEKAAALNATFHNESPDANAKPRRGAGQPPVPKPDGL